MTAIRIQRTAVYVTLGLLIGLLVQAAILGYLVTQDVSNVIPAATYQHRIKPGGVVAVDFSGNKSRQCITQTSRWLWRDNSAGRREVIELSYGAMGFGHDVDGASRDYRFLFEVPAFINVGRWNVRTMHADYCWPWSWFLGPRMRMSPPIGLDVIAGD